MADGAGRFPPAEPFGNCQPLTSLYICYQSIADPLTASQVVAYLEGLALAGHRMFLLTFEARQLSAHEQAVYARQLAGLGIEWSWLRYHKRPTLPATLWDILAGIWHAWRLWRRVGVELWHARGYVPGVMALGLQRLTGGKFLFDIRGLMAEEYADAGVWRETSWLYWLTKRAERWLLSAADGVVILTQHGRQWLTDHYPQRLHGKPLRVIPCCVDLRDAAPVSAERRDSPRPAPTRLAYVGKLGGWYLTSEMLSFFETARDVLPALSWSVWTQSDPAELASRVAAAGLTASVSVGQMAPGELLPYLRHTCHAALCLLRPCRSKLASSPTKIGEYLAAGLPVVLNAGIGDLDELIAQERVGVLLPSLDAAGYRAGAQQLSELLADPGVRARCRRAARRHFDMELIGWRLYREIYALLGRTQSIPPQQVGLVGALRREAVGSK